MRLVILLFALLVCCMHIPDAPPGVTKFEGTMEHVECWVKENTESKDKGASWKIDGMDVTDKPSNWTKSIAVTLEETFSKTLFCTGFFEDDAFDGMDYKYVVGMFAIVYGGQKGGDDKNRIFDSNVMFLIDEDDDCALPTDNHDPDWDSLKEVDSPPAREFGSATNWAETSKSKCTDNDWSKHGDRIGLSLQVLHKDSVTNPTLELQRIDFHLYVSKMTFELSTMAGPGTTGATGATGTTAATGTAGTTVATGTAGSHTNTTADPTGDPDSASADKDNKDKSKQGAYALAAAIVSCTVICVAVIYSMCCKKGKKPIAFDKD